VPDHAQVAIAVAIIGLVLVADLRGAIGFSSCGVLVYYAVANLAALRQPPEQRRWPRAINVLGLVGCVTLVVTLPAVSVIGGLGVLALGVLGRWVMLVSRTGRPGNM
jgi:APA family basic amino acid/polyamine antiporter